LKISPTRHTACQHGAVQQKDKILIKNVHECKGYTTTPHSL